MCKSVDGAMFAHVSQCSKTQKKCDKAVKKIQTRYNLSRADFITQERCKKIAVCNNTSS